MNYDKEGASNSSYSLFIQLLHWSFVILFVYGFTKQFDPISRLENIALFRFEVLFAVAFLLLLAARLANLKQTQNFFVQRNN